MSLLTEPVAARASRFRTSPHPAARRGLPLLLQPQPGSPSLEASADWLRGELLAHGALVLRGFGLDRPEDVERMARVFEPVLANDYLGTSPRDALTPYVFNASELPDYYPIPSHLEMSFVAQPPRTLFFACLVAPVGVGGETTLVDFRAVLRDLDPRVRDRFEALGVRNIRNYDGPASPRRRDLWKLKRWDEMFGSTDRAVVERVARAQGFEVHWKPADRLALVNTQPAVRRHPETGEAVWFNHAQVFHPAMAAGEYLRIARRQGPRWRYLGLAGFAAAVVAVKSRLVADEDQAMFASYGDGSPIPWRDLAALQDAIWKNLVFPRWQRGDLLVIDNRSIGHGRMPYRGPRHVVVAWA